ncbi:hypothetical protein Bca4012_018210 [Brassica carinata]
MFRSLLISQEECTYTIGIQTGTRADSGTDSVIGVVLADKSGEYTEFKNLGISTRHDYFENGDFDEYSGTGSCLPGPVCYMKLTSDGSGNKPGWYVEYVDVTTDKAGSRGKFIRFSVEQWLAIDENPHKLYAERNKCSSDIQKIGYSIV